MSFRKNTQSALNWSKWKKSNEKMLLGLGLPDSVLHSESDWWYFLEHGYDCNSNWEPHQLADTDALALLEFLKKEYPDGEAWNCILDIRDVSS